MTAVEGFFKCLVTAFFIYCYLLLFKGSLPKFTSSINGI